MNFRDQIKRQISKQQLGIEIGPSYNGIARKSDGYNVKILDHAVRETLVAKYAGTLNPHVDMIEEVDFVLGETGIESLKASLKFDYIVSAHNIEHCTDLIRFLKDCEELLAEDGALFLIVPDKRYCFDMCRQLTTTGAAIDAYLSKRERHAGAAFENLANAVTNSGSYAWTRLSLPSVKLTRTWEEVLTQYQQATESKNYVDAHAWVFTPSSFRLIIHDLHGLGYTGLRERDFQCNDINDFFITLDKKSEPQRLPRMKMLRRIEKELMVSSMLSSENSLRKMVCWFLEVSKFVSLCILEMIKNRIKKYL